MDLNKSILEAIGYSSSSREINETADGVSELPSGKLSRFFITLSDIFAEREDSDSKTLSEELMKISKLAKKVN